MMSELILFTDGSVNNQSKIGYGAYLCVTDIDLPLDQLKRKVQVKCFAQTSSAKLELQTLLWALNEIQPAQQKLLIYTDAQNIVTLPSRRAKLEHCDYRSKKNRRLNNYQLYMDFYRQTDQLNCEFIKLRGHQPVGTKNTLEQCFALVDKASRAELRKHSSNKVK